MEKTTKVKLEKTTALNNLKNIAQALEERVVSSNLSDRALNIQIPNQELKDMSDTLLKRIEILEKLEQCNKIRLKDRR